VPDPLPPTSRHGSASTPDAEPPGTDADAGLRGPDAEVRRTDADAELGQPEAGARRADADAGLRRTDAGAPVRGAAFTFRFEGRPVAAHPGETIAAALLAAGVRHLRTSRVHGRPRGLFCGIGSCFDCLVTVDGRPSQRACLTPAAPDLEVEVQDVAHLA
jgi:hypothetical protein